MRSQFKPLEIAAYLNITPYPFLSVAFGPMSFTAVCDIRILPIQGTSADITRKGINLSVSAR